MNKPQKTQTRLLRPAQLDRVRGGSTTPTTLTGETSAPALRDQGIKVYVDVVYNHTAE
jgi:hypothetical protein